MLERLRVSNFAIIDDLQLEFENGFTILTGETGAGKSILLGAMRLLLGDRSDSEMVRAGSDRAVIEGVFHAGYVSQRLLEKWGLTDSDAPDTVIVRRDITASGTSRSYLNGSAATLQQLRELGERQVDMHGQHDHTRLLSPAYQLLLLDGFGDYAEVMANYKSAYQKFHQSLNELIALQQMASTSEKEKAFLEFQAKEIEEAGLLPGEDEQLETERKRLINFERLTEKIEEAVGLLGDGTDAQQSSLVQLGQVAKSLAELSAVDSGLASMGEECTRLRVELDDLVSRLRDYATHLESDNARLSIVDDRLHIIRTLKRKYGPTLDEVIAVGEDAARRLQLCENSDEEMKQCREQCEKCAKALLTAADKLSKQRTDAASAMEKQVVTVMRDLELPKAQLRIELNRPAAASDDVSDDVVEHAKRLSANGAENAEITVSLNAGESLKPLRKVASGGEISRIFLAIKSIVAEKDQVDTLVFDEIDTGISGQAAGRVGEKLAALGTTHQVLCITHLPQIAALGHTHLLVEKRTVAGRTTTEVRRAEGETRMLAIAQMLSGNEPDAASRKYAKTLLERKRGAAMAK